MIGPSGDVMLGTINSSSLKCGSIIQVVDWSWKCTTIYESVPPEGCTDIASYTLSDGDSYQTTATLTFNIAANQPPYAGAVYEDISVNRVLIINVTAISSDSDGNVVTLVKVGKTRYGTATADGNIITYRITAAGPNSQAVSAQLGAKEASTLSSKPVVVAPLIWVTDYDDGDTARLVVLNISRPVYGKLEFLSCCNSVTGDNAYWYYAGGKQVADYRYTPDPSLIKSSDVVENLTYTVSDLKGGLATAVISITIKPGPNCSADLSGTKVSGFIANADTFMNGVIPECGGIFSWTNCFNGRRSESPRNAACRQGDYFNIEDVYGWDSPYNGSMGLTCLLPSRKLPCSPKSNPAAKGVTMWQSLGTEPCSAECDLVTKEFTAPASAFVSPAYDCNGCIDCNPDKCPNTPNGPAIGPEVCCVGAPITNGGGNNTNSTSPPPPRCAECAGQPPAPVCGADGNTYASGCMAACQGVNVSATGSCEGTPQMLDLSQVPDLTSPEAAALMRDGFQVLSVAKTTDASVDDDGFPVPDGTADVSAAAALNYLLCTHGHHPAFQCGACECGVRLCAAAAAEQLFAGFIYPQQLWHL